MTIEADMIADRRKLKRRLGLWRFVAVALVLAIAGLVALAAGEESGVFKFRDHVARVSIDGIITDDLKQQALLRKLAGEDRVKAVILRINSPGGTTAGAEALYAGIRKVAEKKPVIAVLGTVAASGGYIAALAADRIVARGNSITGSIGVIFQWAEVTALLDKLGVKMEEVRSGPLKGRPSPFAETTEEVRRSAREMVSDSFDWFVGLVAERRGLALDRATVLADGRVYTGRQALKARLIDEIGGEEQARAWLTANRKVPASLDTEDREPDKEQDLDLKKLLLKNLTGASGFDGLAALIVAGEKIIQSKRLSLDGLVSVWQPER